MFNRMFNKWGQNAVTPIYTHIPPLYAVIMLFLSISGYNRMIPLLTIDGRFLKMNRLFAFLVVVLPLLVTTPASASDPCNCKGYAGPGGPCYAGPGGGAYAGPGGPAYDGPGGPCYAGPGGPCYSGPGGTGKRCPKVCK